MSNKKINGVINGVTQVKVKRTMGYRISLDETFDIGMDAGEPVSEEYQVPFDFSGKIGSPDGPLNEMTFFNNHNVNSSCTRNQSLLGYSRKGKLLPGFRLI